MNINNQIINIIRSHAKEVWERCVKSGENGEYTTKQLHDYTEQMFHAYWGMKKSTFDFDLHFDNVEDEEINIDIDSFHCSFTKHDVFGMLYQVERGFRVSKNHAITFGIDDNGAYCHYDLLPTEDKPKKHPAAKPAAKINKPNINGWHFIFLDFAA